MESKEFDAWFERVRGGVRAAHHAIGGPRQQPTSVVEAVYELVSRAEVAPS